MWVGRFSLMSLGVLLFWLSSSASLAQFDSGQIAGFIYERRTSTDESGHYTFPNFHAGIYALSVEGCADEC